MSGVAFRAGRSGAAESRDPTTRPRAALAPAGGIVRQ